MRKFSGQTLAEFWWRILSGYQVRDWGIQYHLCSTYRRLLGLVIVRRSCLSGRALVAQARGVLSSPPDDCAVCTKRENFRKLQHASVEWRLNHVGLTYLPILTITTLSSKYLFLKVVWSFWEGLPSFLARYNTSDICKCCFLSPTVTIHNNTSKHM